VYKVPDLAIRGTGFVHFGDWGFSPNDNFQSPMPHQTSCSTHTGGYFCESKAARTRSWWLTSHCYQV